MKISRYLITAGVMALGLLITVIVSLPHATKADFINNEFYGTPTNSAVFCVKNASTLLATSSTNREYIRISNLSAGSMYLGIGVTASSSQGIFLAASSSITFSQSDILFSAPIFCTTDSASATATIESFP